MPNPEQIRKPENDSQQASVKETSPATTPAEMKRETEKTRRDYEDELGSRVHKGEIQWKAIPHNMLLAHRYLFAASQELEAIRLKTTRTPEEDSRLDELEKAVAEIGTQLKGDVLSLHRAFGESSQLTEAQMRTATEDARELVEEEMRKGVKNGANDWSRAPQDLAATLKYVRAASREFEALRLIQKRSSKQDERLTDLQRIVNSLAVRTESLARAFHRAFAEQADPFERKRSWQRIAKALTESD